MVAVFLSLLSVGLAEDGEGESMKKGTFEKNGEKLPYRWIKVGEDENPPLVLFLHGAGERGDDNEAQLRHGVSDLLAWLQREDKSAVVLAPQCRKGVWWAKLDGDFRSPKGGSLPKEPSLMMELVFGAVDRLVESESVDRKKIYVTGLSMGGFGSFAAVAYRPDFFAAAMPVCGGGDPATAAAMKKVPFYVFHGEGDRIVPVGASELMVEALRKAGGTAGFRKYPEVGHDSWSATYGDPEVWEWLFMQAKE